jgi:hypothetical protein
MFKHFLITRFNLRQTDWTTNKNSKPVLTEEWHENRFQLFTDYCFPSVASQKNKNFEWIVFFDTTTPQKYKDVIATLQTRMSNFSPVFVDGMPLFLPSIYEEMEKCNKDYIITSRIDNDDCISENYIDEIQKRFAQQDFMAVDFVDGYTIQTSPDVKIAYRLDQYNPFISLIEKNDSPKTVWTSRHSHWKREKNILQVRDVRIWASVIHEENKVNEFFGFGKVNLDDFFEKFQIAPERKQHLKNNILPYEKWKMESFFNKLSSDWNFSFKNFKKNLGLYNK